MQSSPNNTINRCMKCSLITTRRNSATCLSCNIKIHYKCANIGESYTNLSIVLNSHGSPLRLPTFCATCYDVMVGLISKHRLEQDNKLSENNIRQQFSQASASTPLPRNEKQPSRATPDTQISEINITSNNENNINNEADEITEASTTIPAQINVIETTPPSSQNNNNNDNRQVNIKPLCGYFNVNRRNCHPSYNCTYKHPRNVCKNLENMGKCTNNSCTFEHPDLCKHAEKGYCRNSYRKYFCKNYHRLGLLKPTPHHNYQSQREKSPPPLMSIPTERYRPSNYNNSYLNERPQRNNFLGETSVLQRLEQLERRIMSQPQSPPNWRRTNSPQPDWYRNQQNASNFQTHQNRQTTQRANRMPY